MLEESKVGFSLMLALRRGIDSDNLPQIKKIFSEHQHITPDSYFYGSSSAMHYACSIGALECVDYFLGVCKCNPNSSNSQYGMSPAHSAAYHGQLNVIVRLNEHGADLKQVDNQGENLIHKAVLFGNLEFVVTLLKRFQLSCLLIQEDKNGNVPVIFLQDLVVKGLHPRQLSRENQNEVLGEMIMYLKTKTQEYPDWYYRKHLLQLRLILKQSII